MYKKENFQPMKNKGKRLSSRQLQIEVDFHQCDGKKYFGLYACQNEKGLVDDMYFGPNDSIF